MTGYLEIAMTLLLYIC